MDTSLIAIIVGPLGIIIGSLLQNWIEISKTNNEFRHRIQEGIVSKIIDMIDKINVY